MNTPTFSPRENGIPVQLRRADRSLPACSLNRFLVLIATFLLILSACGKPLPPTRQAVDDLRSLVADGYYAKAESTGCELLEQFRKSTEEETPLLAEITERLAVAMRENGKASDPETMQLAKEAVELNARLHGERHASVATSVYELGYLYWKLEQREEAWDAFESARRIREEVLGPDHPAVAVCLTTMGSLHWDMNSDGEVAMAYFEKARRIQVQALDPDQQDVAWRLQQQAALHWSLRQYTEAISLFRAELKIRENGLREGHPFTGRCHYNLGLILQNVEDYAEARRHLEKGLAIREESLGPDHPNVGRALYGMAGLLLTMGDLEGSRLRYERALTILESTLGEDHSYTARCIRGLADVLWSQGEIEVARRQYERILAICERGGEQWDSLAAIVLVQYGALIQQSGEIDTAAEIYQQARELVEKTYGPDHPVVMLVLHNQAIILHGEKEYSEAQTLFERVLSYCEANPESDTNLLISTLINLALCHSSLGDQGKALDRVLQAEQISRNHIHSTSQTLEERLALEFASMGTLALQFTVSIAAGSEDQRDDWLERAFETVIHWRALCLDELVSRNRAAREASDPHIEELHENLSRARDHLAGIAVSGGDTDSAAEYLQVLEEARIRKERAERELAEASLASLGELTRKPVGLAEVGDSLPHGSALVSFFRYEEDIFGRKESPRSSNRENESHRTRRLQEKGEVFSYIALVLKGSGSPVRVVRLGRANEIEALVGRWRSELQRGRGAYGPAEHLEASYRQAGTALRERIWDPIVPMLDKIDQVFIVPDGALQLINLGSLPDEEGGYLVEAGLLFHYLSAERALTEIERDRATGSGLLALGNPAFGKGSLRTSGQKFDADKATHTRFESLHFQALPQSAKEAEEITRLWNRFATSKEEEDTAVVLLDGDRATERGFKIHAPGKRILHLATHGFFLEPDTMSEDDQTQEVDLLGKISARDGEVLSPLSRNSLLRSGMALAGANLRAGNESGGEDGILTAEEVAGLDLSGVEWVVLSGCDTALGSIQAGEGVFGLRRAFQLAGVRTVIMSLWSVDDTSARHWMETFYMERLKRQQSIPAAARTACVAVLTKRRDEERSHHPFFWAPFVASGDWR